MVKKIFAQTYLWILLLLLYSPIVIIVIYSFTEAKVLGNWTGFSTKLYSSLFTTGAHHSLMNALINTITIALLAATASTLLGSIAAIGIFNLKARSRKAIGFVNSIPILNGQPVGKRNDDRRLFHRLRTSERVRVRQFYVHVQ